MGARAHFLLRAAAIAVLVVEAAYPHRAPARASGTSGVVSGVSSAPARVSSPPVAHAPAGFRAASLSAEVATR